LAEMSLQIETARPRHPHVEDHAAGGIRQVGVEKFAGRRKADRLEARRPSQPGWLTSTLKELFPQRRSEFAL
jgi:hypothetical protein